MDFKDVFCVVCDRRDALEVASCDIRREDAALGLKRLGLARCPGCGLIFVRPQPVFDAQERDLLYGDTYFGAQYMRFYADAAAEPSNESFDERMRLILRHKKSGSLLDIGCAAGGFLAFMRDRGWSVRGVELSSPVSAKARSKGLDVLTGDISSVDLPVGFFDVVCAGDILEHASDPLDFLLRTRSFLKEDGILYLALPRADSLYYRFYLWLARFNHRNYFVLPHHLWHFSQKSLKALLSRAGWRVLEVHGASSKILDRGFGRRVFGWTLQVVSKIFNYQDRMIVIAQKRHDTTLS